MSGCGDSPANSQQGSNNAQDETPPPKKARPVAQENGKIFERDGRKWLYGGEADSQHFDITESLLNDEQYHYGIGREKFHALIKPRFISINEANEIYPDSARFLVAKIGDEVKAYGIDLLTHHEVVNDTLNGKPVMAAYCILADLGAMYDRKIGDKVYTFALSGYTYYDPQVWDGMDGFVFWDRETESLWWPLIGKAVSGPMMNTPMKVLDEKLWSQTTWGEIKEKYPEVKVLAPGQTMEPPKEWTRYEVTTEKVKTSEDKNKAVAPRWGENDEL